jgi:hypothetical protein
MTKTLAFDTETFYDKDITVKTMGTHKYAWHPRAACYLISVCDGTTTWAGSPKDFDFSMLNGAVLLSHNKAFDEEVLLAHVARGEWPAVTPAAWHCTANMSAYLCNRRSLADAAEFLLGKGVSKGMRDWMKGRTWDDAVREGKSEELLRYARDDAQLCWELFDKHGARWPEWERRLSNLTIEQGRRGVHIHQDRLQAGIVLLQRVILAATDMLPWVKTGRAPASPHGVAEACRAAGIAAPPVKAHDADAAAEWEEQHSARFPWIKALKDLRKAKKTLATLETMKERIREDGTMGFSLKYCGSVTRRWAGDAGINFQNFAREPLFVRPDFTLEDNRDIIATLLSRFEKNPDDPEIQSIDVRGLIIAPPGKLIAGVDLSQIEPRVINVLAGNDAFIQKIRDGFPIYEAHARASLGWTGGRLKDENKPLYTRAKIEQLGLNYGSAWEKFITIAKLLGGVDLCKDDEKVALEQSLDGVIYSTKGSCEGTDWRFTDEPCAPYVIVRNPRYDANSDWSGAVNMLQALPIYGANAKKIVADFRAKNPNVVAFWRKLDDAFKAAVGGNLQFDLPSGNVIEYRNIRREIRTVADDEGKPYKKEIITAETDGRRHAYWGSKAAENLSSHTARDVFAYNLLRLIDAGIYVAWTVHDEAVCIVADEEEAERARKIMAYAPPWFQACPVDAEYSIGDRYKK